jgi:TonB-linked SusC/RagA family outer membrane protein
MKNMKRKWQVFLLLLLLSATGAFAQAVTVKGIIKGSDDGQPLPGVIIKIEGTNTGAVSDANGAYKIEAPSASSKLVFSYVGMQTQTVPAGAGGDVNISLKSGVEMKEVVVTALGVSKETKALGYSVSTVSGDAVRESGETNVIESLAAKAPGVQVTGSGGTPGASSKIVIRGNNTLTGDNSPLIIVDGVPIDNSVNNVAAGDYAYDPNLSGVNESNRALDINPDDIESVTILKGAAAAALYGSKASNGAIIYTTKRGKAGKGLSATYSTSVAWDKVNKLPELQTRWAQGTWNGSNTPVYNPLVYGPAPGYQILKNGTGSSWGPLASTVGDKTSYDNVGKFFQTGMTMNNNVSVTAGDEKSSVRLSVGNTHQTGIIPDSKLDRTSVRLTADHKANQWFDLGGSVNYTNTGTEKPQNGSNLSGTMLSLLRTPVNFDASNYLLGNGRQRQYYAVYDNTYFTAHNNPFSDETNRMMGSFFFNVKPTDYLTFTWRTGVDAYHTNNEQIFAVSAMGDDLNDGLGQVNRTSIDSRSLYQDILGKYNKQITQDIGFSAMLGYNFQYEQFQTQFSRGRGLTIPNFYNFSGASSLYTSNYEQYLHTNAVNAEVSLDYKRAIYLDITGRNEWSSTFGKDGKSYFYPKADLSWVFSESIKLPNWFSFGKVRVSYASVGKSPSPYLNKTYYSTPTVVDGWTNGLGFPYNGNPAYGISPTYNNPALKPERTNEFEAGTDLRFLDSRVTLDLTVYSRKTSDVLLFEPVAPSSGYGTYFTNAGAISNKGMEIALGLVPVKMKNFSWSILTNWSKNVSNISALSPGVTQYNIGAAFGDPQSFAIIGQPYGVFYGTTWQRDAKGNLEIGSNGIPVKSLTNSVIGNPNPSWIAGITNTLKYKNLTFSFLWDFRHGGQIYNGTQASLNSRGRSLASDARDGSNQFYTIAGVYAPGTPKAGEPNTTKVTAVSYYTNYIGLSGPAEAVIQDGGWVRLRSVNLSYRFNVSTAEKKRFVQYVEVGASARNLLLFTKYTGVDPETSLTGAGSNISGFDYFNNPSTKSYMLNLKVGI